MADAPWKCERCGAGDNATRYHNPWNVDVSGELPCSALTDVGEEELLMHDFSVCDRCACRPDAVAFALAHALYKVIDPDPDVALRTVVDASLSAMRRDSKGRR